ncbi:hypothetical protein GIB67_017917 [Kingdonia uniflora]|uniref:Bidirectional sugar transporter SWEET n=1 Tax=Kingdonia uniflora TaxID=39325 RepID=A0A7J7NE26_9MAGN|nr:hypothetical protein GIB67_017917 [Kingdonia uniflora]
MMASLSFIIGLIGNIISMLVFLSPVGTFKRVVKKKSTESFKGLPYVCTLLSTSLWTFYGLLKPDGLLVVTVNGAGAVLQAIYVILFLIYAPKYTKVKYLKLVAVLNIGFLGLVVGITLFAIHGSVRLTVVGFLCAGFTLGMYGSPLVSMRTVIQTKSVEYMPFFLSFFLFLNAGVWCCYAVLVKDFFIGVSTKCNWFRVGISSANPLRRLQEQVGVSEISGQNGRRFGSLSPEKSRDGNNGGKYYEKREKP